MKVFISCVKSKLDDDGLHPASELYISPLFKKSLAYARTLTDDSNIFILSAKYGIIPLDRQISTYDLTLNRMSDRQRKQWAYNVIQDCISMGIDQDEEIVFLAGGNYTGYLSKYFTNCKFPLHNLSMGNRLRWLSDHTEVGE